MMVEIIFNEAKYINLAEEKGLAFGCILGGHKGFVSPRMYSIFYAAFHPKEPMEAL